MSQNKYSRLPDPEEGEGKPEAASLSPDSQAFIGLKLRELYDDVLAEPVPDRLMQLLDQLGDNSKKPEPE